MIIEIHFRKLAYSSSQLRLKTSWKESQDEATYFNKIRIHASQSALKDRVGKAQEYDERTHFRNCNCNIPPLNDKKVINFNRETVFSVLFRPNLFNLFFSSAFVDRLTNLRPNNYHHIPYSASRCNERGFAFFFILIRNFSSLNSQEKMAATKIATEIKCFCSVNIHNQERVRINFGFSKHIQNGWGAVIGW